MPSYRYLFQMQKIEGQPSADAITGLVGVSKKSTAFAEDTKPNVPTATSAEVTISLETARCVRVLLATLRPKKPFIEISPVNHF